MGRRPGRNGLEPLQEALDAAPAPRTFFFRDDDAGWANDRLFSLLDLFAAHAAPIDLAVIPAALDLELAARLCRRRETGPGLLAFHQHGYAHANHELTGRPCEFGPSRSADAQRQDIAEGALRLRRLLGETPPIFTPPWNRCTETTGRCLLDLGFRVLARDATAEPLGLPGLQEIRVAVDWSKVTSDELAATCGREAMGTMLHHAELDAHGRARVEQLLGLLTTHEHARCVSLSALRSAVVSSG
jgi:predicted deacetylase